MRRHFFAVLFPVALHLLVGGPVAAAPDRPVIVIPGIVGSELSMISGEVVWGKATSLRANNFKKLDLLPADSSPVELEPTDALRTVPLLFGTINVGVYSEIINFLQGETSIFDSAAQKEIVGDYTEDHNLFVFPYDWRRSNFANAVLLNRFIREKIPTGEDFDVVAHSMGGLLTRAFLSDKRPEDSCIDTNFDSSLPSDQATAVCYAAYGSLGESGWDGVRNGDRFSEADRLHTFIEIATPHRGSVNVASTLVDGWGRLSQILAGGKRDLQAILLSMTGPYELTPSYENCCAFGVAGGQGNFKAAPLDEAFWAEKVLGFATDPCPYAHCASRREILRIGLANRKLLDEIFSDGIPSSVRFNHVVIGRLVENTRETIYVSTDSPGDGVGLTYRTSARGDGTVFEGSALASGNQAFVLRSKHAFIVGSEEVHRYVFNTLINPVEVTPAPVNSERIFVAGADISSLALNATPQIVGRDSPVIARLDLSADPAQPFDLSTVHASTVTLSAIRHGEERAAWSKTVMPSNDLSFPEGGKLVFSSSLKLNNPGVFVLRATVDDRVIAEELLHVLEE